ncbi:MAG: hypothetical protein NTX27_04695 [Verrucomicrobia bacterium]|nr:hypothetical protein [Verrucomicrobiota bacterium]
MILLILVGTLIGVVFKEWKGCGRGTYAALGTAIALLIAGKLLLDYGNYLGTRNPGKETQSTSAAEVRHQRNTI